MEGYFAGLVVAITLGTPSLGQADSLMFDYYSLLGPADAYNSQGVAHNDLCAMVQQDRANWHKFKKREEFDSGDPFFNNAARRSMIKGKCVFDRQYFSNPGARIRNGSRDFYVYIQVFGSNQRVSRVLITEGAG